MKLKITSLCVATLVLLNLITHAQNNSSGKKEEVKSQTRKQKTFVALGRKVEFESLVLNTDFIIPMVKFNVLKEPAEGQVGTVSLFNSVGAGLSLSYGRLSVKYKDDALTEVDREDPYDFKNYLSLQAGVLFSTSVDENVKTSFAPMISLVALDVSIGWGYEFGYQGSDYNGRFWVISYNIPLRKLYSKGMLPIGKLLSGVDTSKMSR